MPPKKSLISDIRMLELIGILRTIGKIRFKTDFCKVLDIHMQSINKIEKGEYSFTAAQIYKICSTYRINANWIMGFEDRIFRDK